MFSIMTLIIGSEGDKMSIASPVIFSKFCHLRHQLWTIIESMILRANFLWEYPVFVFSWLCTLLLVNVYVLML